MIYLLEDDDTIRTFVTYALNQSELETVGFSRPGAFWEAVEDEVPQLVLLDVMLPEEDGLSVLRRLRAAPATARVPVIMLTAKGAEYDKVIALDAGADDYVSKPFGMMEMIARIRALLRRTADPAAAEEYAVGEIRLSPQKHSVRVSGDAVTLTLKEFELLRVLIAEPDIVFTRDQILRRVWGFSFDGESRTVDVHIRSLRAKLGAAGDRIETVRGVGYTLRGGAEPDR
jgi:two-component system alkaline phosphatase synthesis response regulator PhoP